MARITLNAPDNSHRPPNTGDGTEFGDSYQSVVNNLNTMFTEMYAGIQNAALTAVRPAGNTQASIAIVGSSATNTSQTLLSYVLPAKTLSVAGNVIEVTAWGTTASNAAPKSIALQIGGVTYTTGTSNSNATGWNIFATVAKAAANSQFEFYQASHSGLLIVPKNSTDTSVDTGTIQIAVSCADASAAQSNVLLYGFTVEYFN
jgi:hypothetical protein